MEYLNSNIIAVRYEIKEDNGAIWDNDFVMNFSSMKMSIRLDRSYIEDALTVRTKFSTPYFITLLIKRGYLKPDGKLQIQNRPLIVDQNNIKLLSDIVNGHAHYRLPIIYISKNHYNKEPVDIHSLARSLKGIAHVLVQRSVSLNEQLTDLCRNKIECDGEIGIYFPTRAAGHRKYFCHNPYGHDYSLLEKIIRAVTQYNNSQQIDMLFTWQGVNNALLRERLAKQKEERSAAESARKNAENEYLRLLGQMDEEQEKFKKKAVDDARAEADALLESFDEDIAKMQKQIDELTRANQALQRENQGLRDKFLATGSIPIVFMGDERDLYQGEIKDLILSALSDSLNNLPPKSRRKDVFKDILRNNDYKKTSKERASKIKAALKNYDGLTNKVRQTLEELGFEVTRDDKHIKATYYGDERYHITLSKSPSDIRTGKNLSSEAINICF